MDASDCAAGDSANPLMRAVYLRRLRLTRLLLEGGAYVNESDGTGQTPLMVACRTQHSDGQSASRAKLVKYLLERGADPNIQDKGGRSALMHACQERAGPELVSLLLASGADPGLDDRTGNSALVYAVTAGDPTVLKILLDSYKAQGKEVIIITTDRRPRGNPEARWGNGRGPQAPSSTTEKMASPAPASPSEVQLLTSPHCTGSSSAPHKQVFSFKESRCSGCCGVTCCPCSPTRLREPGQGRWSKGLPQPLLRLNSEPWLKVPGTPCSRLSGAEPSPAESLPGREEELFRGNYRLDRDAGKTIQSTLTSRVSSSGHRGAVEKELLACGEHRGRQISLPGIYSSHSASHPNLHTHSPAVSNSVSPSASFGGSKTHDTSLHSVALSGLENIIHRRRLGADHYSSDPQLALKAVSLDESQQRARAARESKPMVTWLSSTLLGSRESPEPPGLAGRVLPGFERRGSGAFLSDHPRSLPPLQLKPRSAPIQSMSQARTPGKELCEKGAGLKTFLPSAPAGSPKEVTRRRALLRRHSMQTEEFKTA